MPSTSRKSIVNIDGQPWVVLQCTQDVCLLTTMDMVYCLPFDDYYETSNYMYSTIRDWLNVDFARTLPRDVFLDVVPTIYNDYSQFNLQNAEYPCTDNVRLMFKDEYLKYRDALPQSTKGWWLADTPDINSDYGYAVIDNQIEVVKSNDIEKLYVRPVVKLPRNRVRDIYHEEGYNEITI